MLPALTPREGAIDRIALVLGTLAMDSAWRIEVHPHKPTRSTQQLRYLNGVCYRLLSEATGYERDEVSEYLCGAMWGWKDKKVPKKPSNPEGIESVPLRTTTTDESGKRSVLTKMEFTDYVEFVKRFAAERGVFIPEPDEEFK